MTEQTGTRADRAGRAPADREAAARDRGPLAAAAAGLLLGLLALGPGIGPGYLLSYDMVFVPRPPVNSAVLGTSGTLPRAVPSDAVVAVLARVLPADVVQKALLLAIFVLACAGLARLLARQGLRLPYQLAGGICYAWNPFVGERLILGQWALLLGYAGLPWVLAAVTGSPAGRSGPMRQALRLAVALLPAAVGGFAAMLISGLVAVPAAAFLPVPEQLGTGQSRTPDLRRRIGQVALALAVLGVLSLPWLVPALTRHVSTSAAGVAAFAARADTPFGTIGSVLLLGGAWNAQTVPAGYGGWASSAWLLLVLAGIAGFAVLGRRRWPGLAVAAAAGLVLALLGAFGPGQALLRGLIGWWPGFAVLRDGQQFAAPLALAAAAGFGLAVGWLFDSGRLRTLREGKTPAAVILAVLPVLLVPGLAWGAAGRLRPVEYPAGWTAAARLINSDHRSGAALLLPWAAYRRFGWNHDEAMLDPWPRLLDRTVVWNDGVQVGTAAIPPEDPRAVAISAAVTGTRPLTGALRRAGYRYVIVDAGVGSGAGGQSSSRTRIPGCVLVFSGPDLLVYRVPG